MQIAEEGVMVGPMSDLRLVVFASTPDMEELGYVVRVLTGEIDEICVRARELGYDGIEFFPDPEDVTDGATLERALKAAGASCPVVDSGRMLPQGMTLLDPDPQVRRRAADSFKRMLDLAGAVGAAVNMGGSRGNAPEGVSDEEVERLTDEIFRDLAQHAERAHSRILLEPTGDYTSYLTTMDEAMSWVDRIASPGFGVMMDTFQLTEAEPSIEHGIRAAAGRADHIHLYDPSRWPPGVMAEEDRLDWPLIVGLLRETGFNGTGAVVLAPEGDAEEPARRSAAYLRELFAA
jgi:sugar phosphate isomerase/epimerase